MKTRLFVLSIATLLTACGPTRFTSEGQTAASITESKQSRAQRIEAAKHLSAWHITGALAAKNKQKNWTATIDWRQQSLNNYQIRLFGPLGGGSVVVKKNGRLITYNDGEKRVTTTNIDQLLYKQTGIRVPLHNLYYWIRGVKAPGSIQSREIDQMGHLTVLKQSGYTIRYENYQTVKNTDLPTKLRVTGPGGSLKLVIKHWEIH